MKEVLLDNHVKNLVLEGGARCDDNTLDIGNDTRWLLCIGAISEDVGDGMKDQGYKCLKFSVFEKAIQWLNAGNMRRMPMPDAILCDTSVSGETLFKKIRRLRKKTNFKDQVIILISGAYSETEKKEAIMSGADDYYSRPDLNFGDLDFRIKFIKEFMISNDEPTDNLKANDDKIGRVNSSISKRAFDILVSGTALLMLSPIMLIVALLIKLDSKGSVFYISKRAGTGYQIFDFYKFRTMRTGADAELKKLAELNKYDKEGDSPVFFKLKHDPRVTKLGHFLRKTSLDELPQLLNVLKGDMSLVGNRPLPLYEAEMLTKDQWAMRFLAPAGITGLWQITKREKSDMTPEERLELDIAYSRDNSFWKDMKILIKTIPAALQTEEQK